jgi:hypothetical protein
MRFFCEDFLTNKTKDGGTLPIMHMNHMMIRLLMNMIGEFEDRD